MQTRAETRVPVVIPKVAPAVAVRGIKAKAMVKSMGIAKERATMAGTAVAKVTVATRVGTVATRAARASTNFERFTGVSLFPPPRHFW